ncbi:MAG TPA: outer membrane beta-barrel protein [Caulobacteraceae bacterium]|nr:outer membrane beta-barrel protein [Caulobacteraceae bacterium]
MRWATPIVGGVAGVLTLGFAAHAESPWYVSGSVGDYFRVASTTATTFFKIDDPSITTNGTNHFSFDQGVMANVAVGYRLTPNVRLEEELGYSNDVASAINPVASSPDFPRLDGRTFSRQSGADYSRFTATVNGFYDFRNISSRFTPFVGIGGGVSDGRRTTGHFADADGDPFTGKGDSFVAGVGLLEAGLNVGLSKRWSIQPAYRYVHIFKTGADDAHVADLGLRYSF